MALTELQRRSVRRALDEFLERRSWTHDVQWLIEGNEITLYQVSRPVGTRTVGQVPLGRLCFDPHEGLWHAYYPDPQGGWSRYPQSGPVRSLVGLLAGLGWDPDALLW